MVVQNRVRDGVRGDGSFAHGINLKVTAVGVETSDQVDFLQTLPVDEVQDYAFAAPTV